MSNAATRLRLSVGAGVPEGIDALAADLHHPPPEKLAPHPAVVVCIPGGGMSRRYFDLIPPGTDDMSWSMAHHLADAGHVVLTVDPPGVGDSDTPEDAFTLDPRTVARVLALAIRPALDALRSGTLVTTLAPMPSLRSIGVGHSAGALLTVHQQAADRTHDALALLGFAGGGLPSALSAEELAFADRPDDAQAALGELARRRDPDPLPASGTATSPYLVHVEVPPDGLAAAEQAASRLLQLVGLASMIPGANRPELDAIDVPVFLGVGEFDITGDAHAIPAQFPGSSDVTLFVIARSGHNHHVAPTRAHLWNRLVRWLDEI